MPPHAHDMHSWQGRTQQRGPYRMDTRRTPQVANVAPSAYPRGGHGGEHHRPNAPENTSAYYPHRGVNEPDDYHRARNTNSTTRARGHARFYSRPHHPSRVPPSSIPTAPRNFNPPQPYPNATSQGWGPHNTGHHWQNDRNIRSPLSVTRPDWHQAKPGPFRHHQNHDNPVPTPATSTWPHDRDRPPTSTSIIPSVPKATRFGATPNEDDTGKSLENSSYIGIIPLFGPETPSAKDVSVGAWNHVPARLGGGGGGRGGRREEDMPSVTMTNLTRRNLPVSETAPQTVQPPWTATPQYDFPARRGRDTPTTTMMNPTRDDFKWLASVQPFSTSWTATRTQSDFPPGLGGDALSATMANPTREDLPTSVTAPQAAQLFSTPRTAVQYGISAGLGGEGDTPSATMTNRDFPASLTAPQAVQPFSAQTATQYDVPPGLGGGGGGDTPSATMTNRDFPASLTAPQAVQPDVPPPLGEGGGDTPPATMTNPTLKGPATTAPQLQAAPQFPSSDLWLDAAMQCAKDEQQSAKRPPLASLHLKFKKKKPPIIEDEPSRDGVSPKSEPKIDLKKKKDDAYGDKLTETEYPPVFADTWVPTPTPPPLSIDTVSKTAMGSTAVTAQLVKLEFATPTQTEASSIHPPQPALKRKKHQASVCETAAGDDEKKVKKARKKKNEGVEIKTAADDVPPAARVQPAGGGEKPIRKKKRRKADGEVLAAAASGLDVLDSACQDEGVEPTATTKIVSGGGKEATGGGDEGREKMEEKKMSERGRKRTKLKDDDEQGLSVKKKKNAKLESDVMDVGISMGDDVNPISGTAAIATTDEWAQKRTKTSTHNKTSSTVKWTTPTVFGSRLDATNNPKPRSSRAKSTKRPPNSSSNCASNTGGSAPERILRPNIWAAVSFLFSLDKLVRFLMNKREYRVNLN